MSLCRHVADGSPDVRISVQSIQDIEYDNGSLTNNNDDRIIIHLGQDITSTTLTAADITVEFFY